MVITAEVEPTSLALLWMCELWALGIAFLSKLRLMKTGDNKNAHQRMVVITV